MLTNLYNVHPSWLELAHKKLDGDLSEEETLGRLLALNLERAGMG